MPNYITAFSVIQDYFKVQWGGSSTIIYDDDENDTPDEKTWVRLNIRHNEGFQSTMGSPGNNRFERRGIITAQIFQKQGNFGIDARELAKKALALFAGVEDSGIFYFDATIREVGNDGRGWYQINVITSFRYNEIT